MTNTEEPTEFPSCHEPRTDPDDCELFGCRNCWKIIREDCSSGGMCEACDLDVNGIVTIRF